MEIGGCDKKSGENIFTFDLAETAVLRAVFREKLNRKARHADIKGLTVFEGIIATGEGGRLNILSTDISHTVRELQTFSNRTNELAASIAQQTSETTDFVNREAPLRLLLGLRAAALVDEIAEKTADYEATHSDFDTFLEGHEAK